MENNYLELWEKYRDWIIVGGVLFLVIFIFVLVYDNDASPENEMAGYRMLTDEFGSSVTVTFDDDKNRYNIQTYSDQMFDVYIDASYGDSYATTEWSYLNAEIENISYHLTNILDNDGYEIFLANPMNDTEPLIIAKDGEVTFDILYD